MTAGTIILLIASIIRGWGILNHGRGPMEAAVIASGPVLAIFSIISIVMGILGAILIGSDTSFWLGIIAFIAIRNMDSILASIGL